MKLTKFVHSCILAEDQGRVVLFDPGEFSWNSGLLKVEDLPKLDSIVITHQHADHFHMPAIKALLEKFPDAQIISTPDVVTQLEQAGIKNVNSIGNDYIKVFSNKQHASVAPLWPTPQNIAVHFADKLTVGGDRQDLEETKDILALTITAPWGFMMAGADMAFRLKPKVAFPVHDWHWNDQARQGAYAALESAFNEHSIKFIKPVDGQSFEV